MTTAQLAIIVGITLWIVIGVSIWLSGRGQDEATVMPEEVPARSEVVVTLSRDRGQVTHPGAQEWESHDDGSLQVTTRDAQGRLTADTLYVDGEWRQVTVTEEWPQWHHV